MFKVGESSKLMQAPVRMLWYYDEARLLKSSRIDSWTGYRVYSMEQIPALNKTVYLRDSGFQVSKIVKALKQAGSEFIVEQPDQKHQEIKAAIQLEQEKLKEIELARSELLNGDNNEIHYYISIKSIPSYQALSLRRIIRDYYSEGGLRQKMSAFVAKHNIPVFHQTSATYHSIDYREQDVDVEICASVEQMGNSAGGFVFRNTEPVPLMALTVVCGPFSNITGAYLTFTNWL